MAIYHYNLKYTSNSNNSVNVDGIVKTEREINNMGRYREVKESIISEYDDVKEGVMFTSLSRLDNA